MRRKVERSGNKGKRTEEEWKIGASSSLLSLSLLTKECEGERSKEKRGHSTLKCVYW